MLTGSSLMLWHSIVTPSHPRQLSNFFFQTNKNINQTNKQKINEIIFNTKPNFSNKIKRNNSSFVCMSVYVCVCVREREKLKLHLAGNVMLQFTELHHLCLCFPIVGLLTYESQIIKGTAVWQNWILLSSTLFISLYSL